MKLFEDLHLSDRNQKKYSVVKAKHKRTHGEEEIIESTSVLKLFLQAKISKE